MTNEYGHKKESENSSIYNSKEHKTILIFVAHRIDYPCETPSNSLYIPVRCGACYDKSDSALIGDNTGDNISEKRMSYCELTVQYWAWKNRDADYYGLCHYRRYFSFSPQRFPEVRFNVREPGSICESASKYRLMDQEAMEAEIVQNDGIIPSCIDIRTVSPGIMNVEQFWRSKKDQIVPECLDWLISYVRTNCPQYYPYLLSYLQGVDAYVGCLYILRKELFYELCEFQFPVLAAMEKELDLSRYEGEYARQPGFMGEILYGAYLKYLKHQQYRLREHQVVLFTNYRILTQNNSIKTIGEIKQMDLNKEGRFKRFIKYILDSAFPAYRVARRNEVHLNQLANMVNELNRQLKMNNYNVSSPSTSASPSIKKKTKWGAVTMTSEYALSLSCLALEIHETHKESFSEFKNCHTGQSVVVVATGPSMRYYTQIPGIPHIGMNAAYKNPNIKLDYYFITDFENRVDEFQDLVNYDFIKFFGQYSVGSYRERFQASEQMILDNNGRRFFQGAPSEDIPLNIEYYPMMGFYTISFQAIQFALYTNPKRIYLVGCDCSTEGYFDGRKDNYANTPAWVKGYNKLKAFVGHFYPGTEIVSVNPVGLKGLFRDVYTADYLDDHPEIDRTQCVMLEDLENY